jgi:hypothetical protein
MQYRDLISGLFWLIMGIILSIWSTEYKVGSFTEPGPSFLPLLLGLLLILLSLILLIMASKSFRKDDPPLPFFASRDGGRRVVYAIVVLLAVAFFFEKIGYLLTLFFLVVLLMRGAAGRQSCKVTLLVAFFSVLGVYLVFVLLLGQQLPRGLLGV